MFSRILKKGGRKRRRKRSNLGDSNIESFHSLIKSIFLPISNKLLFFLAVTFHLITSQSNRYTRHKNRPRFLVHRARGGESSLGARISVVGHRRCVKAAPFRCPIFNKPRRLERVCVIDAREKEGKTKATLPRWNGIHAELPAFRRITLGLRNFHASS